jgi:hypothetical protein
MCQLFAAVALAVFSAAHAGAQAARPPSGVALGSRLRIEMPLRAKPLFGTLIAREGDTLVVQTSDVGPPGEPIDVLDQVRVAPDAIRRVFLRTGRESRRQSVVRDGGYGMLLGAAFGAVSAMMIVATDHAAANDEFGRTGGGNQLALLMIRQDALVIGAVGAAIGIFRQRAEWTELAPEPR